jgi:Skp family chaperone for outer membrane proteins
LAASFHVLRLACPPIRRECRLNRVRGETWQQQVTQEVAVLFFRMRGPGVVLAFLAATAAWSGRPAAAEKARLAVVDVSKVFKNYKKVTDVQRQVDDAFNPRRKKLEKRQKELVELGEMIQQLRRRLSGNNKDLFEQVQAFQKQEFLFRLDSQALDRDFIERMRRDMREVLNDIRAAIHSIAEKRGIRLVMRSADADNMRVLEETVKKPEGKEGTKDKTEMSELDKKVAAVLDPRSTVEVVGRFKRNPVLFGAEAIDITDAVLKTLNDAYMNKGK